MPFTPRRPHLWAARAALPALLLAGCTSAVQVDPAPSAADPVCAEVILSLPGELAGLPRVPTTSQATAGWGSPQAAIVLRCGVAPMGPTTDPCVTVTDPTGGSVDWVVTADGTHADKTWTFVTYGRIPAVEVTVPQSLAGDKPDGLLMDVGSAVRHTAPLRTCV